MNPTNLWNRAIERSVFNRSVARSAPPRSCPVWRGEPPEHSAAALGVRGSRIRRPVRSLRRHARAVALAVLGLAAALFAVPEPAEAQTVTTFVSNTGQAGNDTSYYVRATSFTTGSGTYTLTSVGVRVITAIYGSQVVSNYSPLVQIFENDNNQPGTLLETLTNPASITNRAVNTFTAPAGITLSANTVYWLVTSNSAQPNGIGFQVGTISATTADSGAAARWSIGGALSKLHITTSSWESSRHRIRFQIRATAITDATLRALALSNAADDSAIALSPSFAAGTTSYTAAVLSGMAEITIAPTPTIAGASVAYLDGSDTPIPDADTTKAGQQVSLAVGANTITVQVTAEDTTTTLPYTVTVTRAATRSPDATLRALALSNVADDSAIALSPSFAAGTTSYTAAVLNEVEQITIAPTPTIAIASVAYLDGSDTPIPDADPTKAGQQVPLAVDANTIKVQVTAEDTTTTLPYTVTVTRAATTTVTTFISNTGQAGNDTSYYVRATSFTTGGGTHTLTSVGVRVITAIYGSQVVSNYSPLVQIFENDNNQPGTLLETLTNPASITNRAVNTFTAPAGITLSANTVYWLVTSNSAQPNGIGFQVGTISATTADSGAAARWSIGGALSKLHITTSSWESSRHRIRFQIRATVITDATLRALALSNAADDSAIALSPPFAAGTTSYTAAVSNGVEQITIAPTTTNNGASVKYLNSSDTEIPDADTTKNLQQVSLAVDANTIKVQVTAADGATPKTYTVTVTRTPASAQAEVAQAEVIEAEVTEAEATEATVTVPGPPQNFTVWPTGAHAVLLWSAPENTGGASITTYEYRYAAGDTVPSTTSWTITADEGALWAIVRGLTTGTQYAFEVRAWNSAGAGSAATATATARPLADERPQITLTWDEDAGLEPSFTVTVTFSKAVAGFTLQDILVLGFSRTDGRGPSQWEVRAADLQGSGTTYSVEVTPDPHPVQNLPAGSVLFSISYDAVRTVSRGTPNEQRTEIISLRPSVPSVTGTEREALTTLYTATGGANWTSKDNWLDATKPLGEWHGVTTNTDGEVTQLDLRSNKLRGSLPVELGNLRNLTQLYLQGNKLSGSIPPALGLSSLVDLKLHSNTALSGPLPAIFPTALPDLKELGVQNTGVTIPQTPAFTAWSARITSGTQTSDGVITLDAANTRPSGLWADETTLYVVGEDGGKVYAYTLADGVRDTTKDIDLHADNARPTGLWSDGTTLWVLDYDDRKIYAYTLAGERAAAKDIESVPAGYGLWGRKDTPCEGSDATCLLWLVEAVDRSVQTAINLRAYRIYADTDATPAVTYGSANASFDKDLPTGDLDFRQLLEERGLWWEAPEPDGSPADDVATVWFSDFSGARLYAYSANPRVAESAADIVSAATQDRILAPANLSPTAFWSDGTTWWVADLYAGKVFVYGPSAPITTPPITTTPITTPPTGTGPSGGITGGGTGGGGGSPSQDEHGNTPAQATLIALDPARTAATAGQLNTVADVDYFSADVPHAGVLVVETSGPTATVGTVWQAGAELATAASGGVGRNFRLSVRVAPGPVVIAVAGNGQQTGAYTLQVTFLSGFLENPGAASFQSGIGLISGWTCDAEEVEIVLNGEPQEAAYGTARVDTAGVCGDSDNGFGLLFNWNLLGDGEHEVVALVDGVELDRATVTVTTLGAEFLRDVTGTCTAADFPTMDETVTLAWQQTQQNFVIAEGAAPAGANRAGTAGVGYLENPGPNSFQSGIGVLSGWACEGTEVVIELNGEPQPAAYGTERLDTLEMCGDTDNGFGLLFNWNLLGEGEHEVVAFVDGEELGRATVRVTTLGAEFVRDVEGECTVEDFPMLGETVTLEWQQNSQNFVVTDLE